MPHLSVNSANLARATGSVEARHTGRQVRGDPRPQSLRQAYRNVLVCEWGRMPGGGHAATPGVIAPRLPGMPGAGDEDRVLGAAVLIPGTGACCQEVRALPTGLDP